MSEPSNALVFHPIAAAYWREEIRQNSLHLARLQHICAARGADYAATIAALIVSAMTDMKREKQ